MAEYYAQRASAGLIICEATMAIEGHSAFGGSEPGIYSAAQVAGWRKVTDAVHARGGRIALQLWHGGRACHSLLNGGAQPVAPAQGFGTAHPLQGGLRPAIERHMWQHGLHRRVPLRLFDFPDPNITSEKRVETTIPQQQLFMINSPFLLIFNV